MATWGLVGASWGGLVGGLVGMVGLWARGARRSTVGLGRPLAVPAGNVLIPGSAGGRRQSQDQRHLLPIEACRSRRPLSAITPFAQRSLSILPNRGARRVLPCPTHALSVLAMPAVCRLAISASVQPISRSTWAVCSPRSGVGKPAEGRVSPNCTSCHATRSVPAFAC